MNVWRGGVNRFGKSTAGRRLFNQPRVAAAKGDWPSSVWQRTFNPPVKGSNPLSPVLGGMAARKRARKTKLTKKQLNQRKYAARMRGLRKRAAKRSGGKGRVAKRSSAAAMRRKLGLKAGKSRSRKK